MWFLSWKEERSPWTCGRFFQSPSINLHYHDLPCDMFGRRFDEENHRHRFTTKLMLWPVRRLLPAPHYYSYLLLRWITLRRQLHSLLPEVIPNPRTRWIRVLLLSTASNYQSSAPLLPLTMNATMYQPSSVSVSIKNATPASTNNNGPIEKKPRGDRGPRGGIYDPFPLKFHRVLDEIKHEGMDSIVSWVSHGRAFKIHNPSMFVTDVMPRFFSQSKYTSFQRQLNLYGETYVVWSSTMLLCQV